MPDEFPESLTYRVIGCLIAVHKELGPGFLENIYHPAVEIELAEQNIAFESQKEVAVTYKGRRIGIHRLDLFVEHELVVELKTVEALLKKHYAQVRSYLRAVNKPLGLLVNFSEFEVDVRRVTLDRP
ncbi:MAG: GxxExxY protein [Pirellulales bacterium]